MLEPLLLRAQVVLSEFQAANVATLQDEDGASEDWIEIWNGSDATVHLRGWSLTDDPAQLEKWQFPSTNLAAGRYLVVFASGKDRRTPGSLLHTNFRLNAEGEYLALVQPDGQTVATAFSPAYPPQVADASYGLPMVAEPVTLLGPGAPGKLWVPTNDDLGTNWTQIEFSDAEWIDVRTGVGFAPHGSPLGNLVTSQISGLMQSLNSSAYLRLPFVASRLAELTALKLRVRYNDGFIAYLNGVPVATRNAPVAAAGGIQTDSQADWAASNQQGLNNWFYGFYDQGTDSDGVYDPFTDFDDSSANWTWNGAAWVLGPSNPPWDAIWRDGWQPNGSNSGGVHWPIRRWVSTTTGTVTCRIAFAKENVSCGNGVTLRVLLNGRELFSRTLGYQDRTGLQTNLVVDNLQEGDFLDFALDPKGTDGSATDSCDSSTFAVVVEQSPSEGPTWNSTATTARRPEESIVEEEINLTSRAALLTTGTNILAIHALNSSADSADFLILPQLIATRMGMRTSQAVYFTTPTPGAPNLAGATGLGPIIRDAHTVPAEPNAGQSFAVQVRITPTLRPVGSALVTWRWMYGNESTVALYDDGQHDDGAAGDSVYGARIPGDAAKAGQMFRYFIVAADVAGEKTRAPTFADPTRSAQYFGTVVFDPTLAQSRLPVLHWFIERPGAADSDATARCAFYFDGEFYDNAGANLHGQSTRSFPKKSYDLSFNPGENFRWSHDAPRVSDLNLLTTWADKSYMRNVLAHETYRDAGAPSHFAFAVRVQRNGAFLSVANVVENGGGDFLERLGLDRRGALYKMYNLAESVASAEKKTRREEGTADLQALITGMTQVDSTARRAFLFDNLNVPEMIDFLAAKIITADTDCCHKNYYLYRDSEGTGEWQAMPWDVDLSFGRVWTCGSPCLSYFDQVIYTNQPITIGYGNRVFTPLFDTPATRQMFLRRLRSLMDQLLQPPGTDPTNDFYRLKTLALRDQIAPDAALDLAKWGTWGTRETITQAVARIHNEFLPGRRAFLFRTMSVTQRGEIPSMQPPDAVVQINDLEPRPASGNPLEEWLSLTNGNSYAVDLSGWRLEGGVRFQFKPGTVIPARSVLFVSPDVKAFRSRAASPKGGEGRFVVGPYAGNLSAWGETVTVLDTAGRLVSSHSYAGDPSPAQRDLRITELFYNPDAFPGSSSFDPQEFEFVELRNIGAQDLDLRGVRFTKGVQFDFTTGAITHLAAGDRLLVVRNTDAFGLRYGGGLPVAGQFTGSLDSAGERLRLEDASGEPILDFTYDNRWYDVTDGYGYSLTIRDDTLPWSSWGSKESWQPSRIPGGTPGRSDDNGPPPALHQLALELSSGSCRLRFTGTVGKSCEFQRSFDLIRWEALGQVAIPPGGVAEYLETRLFDRAAYYRALQR